jgi:hypothetical protein
MTTTDEAVVRAELAQVSSAFGKAETTRRLLAYLVECSLRNKVPKETDIAIDVFQRDANFDSAQDSVVRVAVRALRQKLDEYYRDAGRHRPLRFELPRGGYRIYIVRAEDAEHAPQPAVDHEPFSAPEPAAPPRQLRWALGGLAAALVLSILVNLWFWWRGTEPAETPHVAHTSALWAPLLNGTRPITVVLGDHLLFPSPTPQPGRVQLIRDARVNTNEELRAYLESFPQRPLRDPGIQVATTLVPKSVALGLTDIMPVVRGVSRPFNVRILDEWPTDELLTHDLVLMGPLARIGPLLSDLLFRGSRYVFEHDDQPRRLRDRMTGQEYRPSTGRRENATDYGLLVSFRGPADNRIMVFASVGSDLGLMPLIRRATSESGLAELHAALTGNGEQPVPDEFEALIEVVGYHRTDLSSTLLAAHARPLSPDTPSENVTAQSR